MSVPAMAAVAAGALLLGAPVLIAANSAVAGARAASAADSAALAAADALIDVSGSGSSRDPCAAAHEVAALHDAKLDACVASESLLDVRVEISVRAGLIVLTRTARAGPPNTGGSGPFHTDG